MQAFAVVILVTVSSTFGWWALSKMSKEISAQILAGTLIAMLLGAGLFPV
ncbi:hypothetical protein [Phytohalomonas tamaricis]|nr:hypothetical protein [Phytohalomonas tamaricis]